MLPFSNSYRFFQGIDLVSKKTEMEYQSNESICGILYRPDDGGGGGGCHLAGCENIGKLKFKTTKL